MERIDGEDIYTSIGDTLRAGTRLVVLAVWTFLLISFRIVLKPIKLVSLRADQAVHRFVMCTWAGVALKIMGVDIDVRGSIPKIGHFLVANHLSYLDILVFAKETGSVFIAMKEMNEWPVAGFVIRNMDTVFVDRFDFRDAVRVNEEIVRLTEVNQSVMIFPESTTSIGDDVLPFKPALLQVPSCQERPVHYAVISYDATEVNPNPAFQVCWVDDTPFHEHAWRMLKTPRIQGRVHFGANPVVEPTRRELAAKLESNVRELLRATAGITSAPPDSAEPTEAQDMVEEPVI